MECNGVMAPMEGQEISLSLSLVGDSALEALLGTHDGVMELAPWIRCPQRWQMVPDEGSQHTLR